MVLPDNSEEDSGVRYSSHFVQYRHGDVEVGENESDPPAQFLFNEKSIRLGFIRKVYGILSLQLLITLGLILVFVLVDEVKTWVANVMGQSPYYQVFLWVVSLMILMALVFSTKLRRTTPYNFIALGIFTLWEAWILGSISAVIYKPEAVLLATGICELVCLVLTMFSFQTKWDFTGYGGLLLVSFVALLCFGIGALIFPGRIALLRYCSVGILVVCIDLVHNTQLMLGGEHKYTISPEEYVFAVLTLYVDIILLFRFILALVGLSKD